MTPEGVGEASGGFNAERLKNLPYAELAEQLINEAYEAAALLNVEERVKFERLLDIICWLPADEEIPVDREEPAADMQETVPAIARRLAGKALADIELLKEQVNVGVRSGCSESDIYSKLIGICKSKETAGIDYGSEFVRAVAMRSLKDPGLRGVVLLHNVATGDQASFEPASADITESMNQGGLSFEDAAAALNAITDYLLFGNPYMKSGVKDIAIDLIGYMRRWKIPESDPAYLHTYGAAVANFAVILRDLHS